MSLNNDEKALLEAIKGMFQRGDNLGLKFHDDADGKELHDKLAAERGLEYLHNYIDEMFANKAANMTYADAVTASFHKVHAYKYLDDPSFITALEKELVAQAIPANERAKAKSIIADIIEDLKEGDDWNEKDISYNSNLDEVINVSKPEQDLDFEILDDWGYQDTNVESEPGNGSPSRTPSNKDHESDYKELE